eukprot:CAMPEP_0172787750 /NCGR_PEP_ID=MMETSP1074-20121228/206606_1 /TAXON_ID=2916 /ORGANISM="Ceratium fusus, Strain PA161109" /LENGTH=633 /DNA_ID=CAMNT_0013624771 /DNA_START=18 /DNA_END=1919 /DNA_ORIENTATION=-
MTGPGLECASPARPTLQNNNDISEWRKVHHRASSHPPCPASGSATHTASRAMEDVKRLVQRHHDELVQLLEQCLQQRATQPSTSDPPTGGRSLRLRVNQEGRPQQRVHYVMSNEEAARRAVDSRPDAADGTSVATSWPASSNGIASSNGLKKSVVEGSSRTTRTNFTSLYRPRKTGHRQTKSRTEDCIFESTKEEVRAKQTWLQRVTRSWHYEWFSGFLIISNSIFIGYQTENHAHDSASRADNGLPVREFVPIGILVTQAVFTFLFLLELLLRWASDGLILFFKTPDYLWSIMDVMIVGFSLVDTIWNLAALVNVDQSGNSVLGSVSVLRMVRVIRIVKIVRVIRIMSFFRELRIMVYSILGSMKSLLWVAIILGTTFYIFAVTFTAATIAHLDRSKSWRSLDTKDLRDFYGSVDKSMLSLYMAMSGGNDWGMAFTALSPLEGQYQVFFLLFITFAIFAVLNIVTGVFVDTAMSSNSRGDRQIMIHEELEGKKQYLQTLQNIFDEMDHDGGGTISLAEFEAGLNDEKVVAFFRALKLDVSDTRTFFKLFEKENEDQITLDEFLQGCYRLHGDSRSLDTKHVQRQIEFLSDSMEKLRAALIQVWELQHVNFSPGLAPVSGLPDRTDEVVVVGV